MSRWTLLHSWRQLSLPRLELIVEGDYVAVTFTVEVAGCDPALLIDLDLSGTRTGKKAADLHWWLDSRRPFRYWLRPFDQLADQRRWRWQPRHGHDVPPELHAAVHAAVLASYNKPDPCPTCHGSGLLPPTGLQPDGWAEAVEYTDPPPCPDCGGLGERPGDDPEPECLGSPR